MASLTANLYSAREAGEKLKVTEGRVRQICRWSEEQIGVQIGQKIGRDWFLTESDLELARMKILRTPKIIAD